MKLIEIAKKAKELIEDPARWTQNHDALDYYKGAVEPKDRSAVCWCARGAIDKVSPDKDSLQNIKDLSKVCAIVTDGGILLNINDQGGHKAIVSAFGEMIEYLEKKGEGNIDDDFFPLMNGGETAF